MNRPEEKLQRACVGYLRAALPKPWLCWHTPNGGGRSKAEAGILKAMGVLAGMPDLFVMGPLPIPGYEGLERSIFSDEADDSGPRFIAIEFKAPPRPLRRGGVSKATTRLSPAQRAIQADLGVCGVPYLVIDDMADMVQSLKALGVPLRGRVA